LRRKPYEDNVAHDRLELAECRSGDDHRGGDTARAGSSLAVPVLPCRLIGALEQFGVVCRELGGLGLGGSDRAPGERHRGDDCGDRGHDPPEVRANEPDE
jgi:hypothetical protein